MDTDSIYARLDDVVEKSGLSETSKIVDFLDAFCEKKMQPILSESCQKLHEELNSFEQKIYFKREKISQSILLTGKKRYICNVWDSEGLRYKEPEIAVTGIESVKSSTPMPVRKALEECFRIIMNKDNVQLINYIEKFRKEYKTLNVEDISLPRSINDLGAYTDKDCIYKKATPIHVRGSLLYNHYIKKNNLENNYRLITDGEKVKFLYLKTPNPIFENVIAFPSFLPKELELHKYIDHNLNFEKAFIAPLETILGYIGWDIEEKSSIEDFF
jgi:DNA polymerase elongation subunit (family B)